MIEGDVASGAVHTGIRLGGVPAGSETPAHAVNWILRKRELSGDSKHLDPPHLMSAFAA